MAWGGGARGVGSNLGTVGGHHTTTHPQGAEMVITNPDGRCFHKWELGGWDVVYAGLLVDLCHHCLGLWIPQVLTLRHHLCGCLVFDKVWPYCWWHHTLQTQALEKSSWNWPGSLLIVSEDVMQTSKRKKKVSVILPRYLKPRSHHNDWSSKISSKLQ